MTTLQDALNRRELSEVLLRLTSRVEGVTGVLVQSATAAEIWIAAPDVRAQVEELCSEHPELAHIILAFRDDTADAESTGAAAKRTTRKTDGNSTSSDPSDEAQDDVHAASSEVDE